MCDLDKHANPYYSHLYIRWLSFWTVFEVFTVVSFDIIAKEFRACCRKCIIQLQICIEYVFQRGFYFFPVVILKQRFYWHGCGSVITTKSQKSKTMWDLSPKRREYKNVPIKNTLKPAVICTAVPKNPSPNCHKKASGWCKPTRDELFIENFARIQSNSQKQNP